MDDQLTTDRPRDRRFALTFTGLLLAMLLAALDQTIVSTALPSIVRDLGGIQDLSWVVTAYLLTATVSTPLWGRISDLYGRKRLFQAAIAVFLLGSALSGMAQGIGELIVFRGLQGLGAGGLMTLAMAIVADIVAPRERGRYQGYIQMTFAVASIAGPLLGGLFTDHASWRWAFYVNLPIGLVALAVITTQLQLPAVDRGRPRIDYLGGALLGGSISSVLLVTVWGGQRYAWGSAEILGLIGAAVVLLGAFVAQERRAPEPILPLRLFAEPVFAVVSVTLFLTGCAFFAAIVFMPVFLQLATGASATNSGLLLLPMLLSGTAATALTGRVIARTGRYKPFPIAGLALMATALYLMSTMGADTSRALTSIYMVVFGIGFGGVTQVLVLAVQNGVDRRDIGVATGSTNLFRALGGSVAVALYGSILAGGLDGGQGGSPAAVADALHPVFLLAAGIAVLALISVLFLREVPLAGPAAPPKPERATPTPDRRVPQGA
jgi:EmrB/QacA subfamily drug resistance transporter